jgi:anthranilate synthase component 1
VSVRLEPGFSAFCEAYEAGRPQLVWAKRVSDLETPVSAMLKLGADRPGSFILESVEGGDWRGRYSILGVDPDLVWRIRNGVAERSDGGFAEADFQPCPEPPLTALRALLQECRAPLPPGLPPPAAGLFGYLAYDLIRYVERLPDAPPDPLGLPEAVLLRPRLVAVFDNVAQEITLVTPVWPSQWSASAAWAIAERRLQEAAEALDTLTPRPASAEPEAAAAPEPVSNTSPAQYRAIVERVQAYCRAGDCFQVVPSQRFSAPFALPSFALYRALRRLNPSPFLFHLSLGDFAIVGSSPEILVRLRDGEITVRPIAGTRPRGATPAQDLALEEELLADPKERAEHLMLVDLARNDVGRVARRGLANDGKPGVRVTDSFFIERYSHVMHIVSNVEGTLAAGRDALDALLAGFPHGTVTGAPKVRAMEIIDEVESVRRGVYAGGVGYFSVGGDMDTCIALRTAVLKDAMMHVQAGGGVVLDSDPQAELEETQHKARALFRAAAEAARFR